MAEKKVSYRLAKPANKATAKRPAARKAASKSSANKATSKKAAKRPAARKAATKSSANKAAANNAAAKRPAAKQAASKPAPRPEPLLVDWPREPGLEDAIIAAPLDPVPRMVYADWLQAAGDLRGEWMAIHSAIENDPKNVRLRSMMVEMLGKHRKALLSGGHRLLPGAWIGWRGGFIDEIRVQPFQELRDPIGALRELLAHPICRFLRRIGFGEVSDFEDIPQLLIDAKLPLLDTVVAIDTLWSSPTMPDDVLAQLPTLRRLGAYGIELARPLPELVELTIRLGEADDWISRGNCIGVEELTLDCDNVDAPARQLYELLGGLPKLRRLRLLHVQDADTIVGNLLPFAGRLELLDLSYSSLTDAGAAQLAKWPGLTLVAIRTALTAGMVERLAAALPSVTHSKRQLPSTLGNDRGEDGSWLHHRIATEGRDGLLTLPGIGNPLYSIGTNHSIDGRSKLAVPLLDASLTFPTESLKTWAWANAAIAHERLLELDEAELIAREGLIRTPTEPNLYAIVVDALRRSGQLERALKLLPDAIDSVTAKPGSGAHVGGPAACLADVLLVLAQAGKHEDVLALAAEHPELVASRKDMYSTIAISQVALGALADARTSLRKADGQRFPAHLAHARAVVALAGKKPDIAAAIAELSEAKGKRYQEWHWLAFDPCLDTLRELPAFQELIATPPASPS